MNSILYDIDNKKPLKGKQDYRTSTYRAHRYISGPIPSTVTNSKKERIFDQNEALLPESISDYKHNFGYKTIGPDIVRNPPLDSKVHFMNYYADKLNYYMKVPLKPAQSTTKRDFTAKRQEPEFCAEPIKIPSAPRVTPILIDRSESSFVKYLDPSATTQRLDYCAYTTEKLLHGIAKKDHITFWNWNEQYKNKHYTFRTKEEFLCDSTQTKKCTKPLYVTQSSLKHVPHTGLTTETRANYQATYKKSIEHFTDIQNELPALPDIPFPTQTEQKLIGSGERLQKYI